MAGVSATIDISIKAKQTGTAHRGAAPSIVQDASKSFAFTAGTAATSQANVLYSETRTLAASTGEDLDLAGVLADALGATITAAEIVAIYIAAAAGNTNDVQLTRPASNGVPAFLAAGDGLAIGPGDAFLLTNKKGIAVAAGTGDLLHVLNGGAGTSVEYDVVIIGRTVAA
jgi:hypothetical protein